MARITPDPLKRVIGYSYVGACRYTGWEHKSIRLDLECGHDITRKASEGVPRRARCRDCGHLARGGTITYGEA